MVNRVTVRGIVTASWQAEKELGGFFIESAPMTLTTMRRLKAYSYKPAI